MGDSYSSGEGASDYEPGTDFDDRDDAWPFNDDEEAHNRCHRSGDAYARILGGNNAFAGGSTFVACSGSVISDLDNPNHKETGEEPQTDALGEDVSLVTLTLGGNDLGFADVVEDCIRQRRERTAVPGQLPGEARRARSPNGCPSCAASCWPRTRRSTPRLPTPGSSSSAIRSSSSTTPATTTATCSSPRTSGG